MEIYQYLGLTNIYPTSSATKFLTTEFPDDIFFSTFLCVFLIIYNDISAALQKAYK